jgi:hypothetical protein
MDSIIRGQKKRSAVTGKEVFLQGRRKRYT